MSREWWDGLLPVEVRLECSGGTHAVRWHDGALNALDHEDPAAERALAALGGERTRCIELLDAWSRHTDDLRVLTITSRGPSDPVQADSESRFVSAVSGPPRPGARSIAMNVVRPAAVGWVSYAPLSTTPPPGPGRPGLPSDDILDLLALSGALTQRLVAQIVATWAARLAGDEEGTGPHVPALTAALFGRVLASVRTWLGEAGSKVELEMIAPTVPPSLAFRHGVVFARLPFAWLSDIWVKDLAVVLGRFALGTIESDPGRLRLSTVGPDFTDVRPVTVSLE
jgi:hypothetical protein